MTNLDEKKLDESIKQLAVEEYPVVWVQTGNKDLKYDPNAPNRNHFIRVYKDGYRQAFADQQQKIEKLEKAVELMRKGFEEVKDKAQAHANFTRNAFGCIANETLAEVDSILKEGE